MIGKRTKSILEEINTYVPEKNREDLIETRAGHVISSAIFLLQIIEESYTEEEAKQLTSRLISSIKGKDSKRFIRSIRKIKEGKDASSRPI